MKNKPYLCIMAADNKHYETGSNPYYLNLNNTAKDFSAVEATNPQFSLLDTLSKFVLVINDSVTVPHQVVNDMVIEEGEQSSPS